jgi:hypothetical protein
VKLTEALTQAHDEVRDNLEDLTMIDRYCSGWRRWTGSALGFYKNYELNSGHLLHVEIDLTSSTRITYGVIEGR